MGYVPPPIPPDDGPGYTLVGGSAPEWDVSWWQVWIALWLLIDLDILMHLPGAAQ